MEQCLIKQPDFSIEDIQRVIGRSNNDWNIDRKGETHTWRRLNCANTILIMILLALLRVTVQR